MKKKLDLILEVTPSADHVTTEMLHLNQRMIGITCIPEGCWFRKINTFNAKCSNSHVAVLRIVHQGQWLLVTNYFNLSYGTC